MRDDGRTTRHEARDDTRDPMWSALRRLRAAADRAGLAPAVAPATAPDEVLAAIADAVHPLALPAEVAELWRAVDPATLPLRVLPEVLEPAGALGGWRMFRDVAPGQVPRALFPIAYEDHGYLLVELHDARGLGGSVFHWSCGGAPFALRHRRLTDYVLQMAGRVERGAFETASGAEAPGAGTDRADGRPQVPVDAWAREARALLTVAPRHPLHAPDAAYDDDEPSRWPAHWLPWSIGGSACDLEPRGASTSLADLLAARRPPASSRPAGVRRPSPPDGTVHARVDGLTRIGDLWYVDLVDRAAQVVGILDARLSAHGPRPGDRYEVDLVLHPTSEGMLVDVAGIRPLDL